MAPRAALRVAEGSSPVSHAPKGFAGPLARFVGCQYSNPPQGELSRPASRISVLDDPCAGARWLDPQSEAGQVAVSISVSRCNGLQSIDKTLGELGQGSLRKGSLGIPWPGTLRGHLRGKTRVITRFTRAFP